MHRRSRFCLASARLSFTMLRGLTRAAMLTPQQGERIANRYRLERELARGGMGSVWAGRDEKLRRKVAVKLVAPDCSLADDADATSAHERFEREAMAVAQLQSPHVVQVFDYGVERGYPYIVMELLEGEDLRTRLHAIKRVSLETAAHILVQTAKALSVAHAAGIVHRDLKPGNIFLVRAGEEEIVKVLDFGVAQNNATDLLDHGGEPVMGTPQFMSPEHARGMVVDHRTDLWSLGVIVYKALTGHLPFQGRTPTSVIVKVCTLDPKPIHELAPDLPHELEGFFQRALSRDRDQRFGSAREMALAFSRISPVTFTTLSMPDPAEIEEAIRRAREAAAEEDDATVAFDALTRAVDGTVVEDHLETVVHDPSSVLPRLAAAIPPPTPPPRRSRATAPSTDDEDEAPTTAVSAEELSELELLVATDDDLTPAAPPSRPIRPSTPTLRGLADRDSSPPPDDDRSARPTLMLALGAVLVGVLVAFIGSAVLGSGKSPAAEGASMPMDGRPVHPADSPHDHELGELEAEVTAVSGADSAETTRDDETETDADDDAEAAARPVVAARPPAPRPAAPRPAAPRPPAPRPVAPKPPPSPVPVSEPPPPAPAPAPPPKPPAKPADPFAERL